MAILPIVLASIYSYPRITLPTSESNSFLLIPHLYVSLLIKGLFEPGKRIIVGVGYNFKQTVTSKTKIHFKR
jgi:hypothetical protein